MRKGVWNEECFTWGLWAGEFLCWFPMPPLWPKMGKWEETQQTCQACTWVSWRVTFPLYQTVTIMKHPFRRLTLLQPPAFRMYTPPPGSYIFIKCMKGRGGQVAKPGDGKRCQEGLFIIIFDWMKPGGDLPCTSTKQYLGSIKKEFLWGVSCYYELSIHCKLKILKCMKHRGGHVHAVIWMRWDNIKGIKYRGD